MTAKSLLVLPLLLVGISDAQETNFSEGPQYLITTGSPMLMRPIATPSLSLGELQPVAANITSIETVAEPESSSAIPSDTFLGAVYWGEHKPSELVARRLETPSMSPADTAAYMNLVVSQVTPLPAVVSTESEVQATTSVIEITGSQVPTNLPASILDVGVTGMTDSKALVARGYGVPLGDVAAYWKAHKRTAPRVFTNPDVVRLHQ